MDAATITAIAALLTAISFLATGIAGLVVVARRLDGIHVLVNSNFTDLKEINNSLIVQLAAALASNRSDRTEAAAAALDASKAAIVVAQAMAPKDQ